ncbi:MAG: transketolase [Candidatus Parcubacteria bacterium]|nr:MAG: transketolase [Candidatus Parcubacteria bacterium]
MIEELHDEKLKFLEEKANQIRELIIDMLLEAGSGHSAGPLGMADIFSAFYFHILRHDSQNPDWPDRDRLILSNGHICPVRYAAMALAGYFPVKELKTLRKINTRLQGHPHRTTLLGVETSSGPLGEGISQAIGIAYAGILDKKDYHVYCITSDGEHQEGNTWEAYMWLGKNNLPNLTIIIDRNYIQIDGVTEDVMPLEPFKQKLESFGLHVLEIDGHNIRAFIDAIRTARSEWRRTSVIIAYTIPGKGVSFMERKFEWHGKAPNKEESKKALDELRTLEGKIISEHQ